jgi:hypothetical protein
MCAQQNDKQKHNRLAFKKTEHDLQGTFFGVTGTVTESCRVHSLDPVVITHR